MAELSEQQEQDLGETKEARRSRSGFWFGVIILLIIIGLAGAGFYLFTQLRSEQEGLGGEVKGQMSRQIADYQSQLTAIQSQLATLEANIAGKDTHFTKTLADFSQLHNEKLESTRKELNDAIARVQRQLGKTRGDWLIADAEYLLSVANERLHLIGDVNTTREA
ncbi:MAG TPA: enzyme of heme biosynthesis, partial [Methylomicrobium sp.]|nr:enzyme of heme biosynthesis [Methylomicrobium sp.]